MRPFNPRFLLLTAATLALSALADRGARRLAGKGYTAWTGERPPRNPATPGVSWGNALLWTGLAGALGGVARMAARRFLTKKGLPAEE